MRVFVYWLATILFYCGYANAADLNPVITSRGWDDDAESIQDLPAHTLKFKNFDVHVNIVGGFAQTRIEATVHNPTDEDELEGDFRLIMPEGSIVNGYALDIEGILVDGVIIAKERGEKAYTDKVTENVDPGLAEITGANTYRTRIYPINSKEIRSFAVEFATPLLFGNYELPFNGTGKIGEMTITIEGDTRSVERATLPSGSWIRTSESKIKYSVRAKNIYPNGALNIPASPLKPVITEHNNGQKFVSFTLGRNEKQASSPPHNTKTRIYWDNSYSRLSGDLDRELRLINALTRSKFSNNPNFEIELVIGNSVINAPLNFKGKQVLDVGRQLENIIYEGATDLKSLLSGGASNVDTCIIFTDGHGTLGGSYLPKLDCRVFTVSTDKNANRAYLQILAEKNGGRFYGPDNIFALTDGGMKKVTHYSQLIGSNLDQMRQFVLGREIMLIAPISGVVPTFAEPVFRDGSHVRTIQKRISDIPVIKHNGPATLWAQRIAEEIRAEGEAGYLPLIAHASKYNLPGPETSLIVLETPDDYVEADIEPPATYPTEEMAKFIELQAEKRVEKLEEKSERLEDVIDIWEDQKAWWGKDFAKIAKLKQEKRTRIGNAPQPAPAPTVVQEPSDGYVGQDRLRDEAESDEVVVTGSRIKSSFSQTKITTKSWSPDRPYLTALKAANSADLNSVYLEQRKIHGQNPAFFLDVGDFYHQRGDDAKAAQVVLSALELEISGSITRTAVANRLLDYGYSAQAVSLLRLVALRESFRPQPFYDLAIALTAYGDVAANKDTANTAYLEALQNFDTVIRNTWNGDYDGAELVALMDANVLINKLPRKLKHHISLDERLIANLDVDLRVIIDWNFDRADMDLWVIEPSGEKSSYRNQETRSGGQLSNDMTSGYGPEQYLIRKAPKGIYKVIADFYGSDAYNPNGAIAVRARLFKDFGRKNQTMQSVTIEFTHDKGNDDYDDDGAGEYDLAEIEVK